MGKINFNYSADRTAQGQVNWKNSDSVKDDLQSLEQKYQYAIRAKADAKTFEEYLHVKQLFEELGNYKDAVELNQYCEAVGEKIYENQINQSEIQEKQPVCEKKKNKTVHPGMVQKRRRTLLITMIFLFVFSVCTVWYYAANRWTDIIGVSCGYYHTLGLRSDGTVKAVGYNRYGQCAVMNWEDIVQVAVGEHHSVGLKSDGTVIAIGSNKYGQCDVTNWTDITAVSACEDYTIGLKSDGTVVATGRNTNGQCDVGGLTDIVQISASRRATVALNRDGKLFGVTVSAHTKYLTDWPEVVKISTNKFNFMGLRPNGTVVCTGSDLYGQLAVDGWTDIVDIASGYEHSVGLKSDGTVVAAGFNTYGECDVENWTDIVAIAAGNRITIGIKADGSVVAAGDYKYGGLMAVWAKEE